MNELDVNINVNVTIKRLCDDWDSFDSGLAEIIKNSNDQYERLESNNKIKSKEREIILFFRDGNKSLDPAIGVLDFGGMTKDDIIKRLLIWNQPKKAEGIMDLASLGNGGKIFALRFFDESVL